ncbi:50S ribosomal protein L23 [Candidatus Gracilibacteria bacterium]|nr:50S ribosomal protein L23 [Candidatus Gracilibacteria bacterium]
MIPLDNVLVGPVVTEKTVAQKGKFSFLVQEKASKKEIKGAIERFYGVKVAQVNTSQIPEKFRLVKRGVKARKRAPLKKAVVTLQEGGTLDFNAFK